MIKGVMLEDEKVPVSQLQPNATGVRQAEQAAAADRAGHCGFWEFTGHSGRPGG